MNDKYRITAKVRTDAGSVRTVRFSGNADNMHRIMKKYFHAVEFKLVSFGSVKYSNTIPWEKIS